MNARDTEPMTTTNPLPSPTSVQIINEDNVVLTHSGITVILTWRKEHDNWRASWWYNSRFPFGRRSDDRRPTIDEIVEEAKTRFIGEPPPEDHSQIWGGYTCSSCGAAHVKLWRDYNCFLDNQSLTCKACTERKAGKPLLAGDQIGWHVPAVPTPDGSTFWGYSSVPEAAVQWWRALPDSQPNWHAFGVVEDGAQP